MRRRGGSGEAEGVEGGGRRWEGGVEEVGRGMGSGKDRGWREAGEPVYLTLKMTRDGKLVPH